MMSTSVIRPLAKRQMRLLKWFLIGYMVVCGFALFMLAGRLSGAESDIWRVSFASWHGYSMPLNIIGDIALTLFLAFGILSLLMAVAQQIDALNQHNAQLLGSMPVTRGRCLASQLMPALGVIALTALVYGLGSCAILAKHREMLDLGARISGMSELMLIQNSMLLPISIAIRLMVLMVTIYLFTTAIMGLFGNAGYGAGFLVALLVLIFVVLASGYQISYQIHALLEHRPGFEAINTGYRSSLLMLLGPGITSYQIITPPEAWPNLPWDSLGWFLVAHAALWSVSLLALFAERRRLAIENLGSALLYSGTRWTIVAYGVLWTLLLPLLKLTEYSTKLKRDVITPYLPALFIPAVLILLLGWWLLIKRPKHKARLKAIPVAVLIIALLVSPTARADYDASSLLENRIKDEFVGHTVALDQNHTERVAGLCAKLKQRVLDRDAKHSSDDDWDDLNESYMESGVNFVTWDENRLTMGSNEYINAAETFTSSVFSIQLSDNVYNADMDELITAYELAEDLKAAGYESLASGCVGVREALLSEDGLWLRLSAVFYEDEGGELQYQYTYAELFADSPFTIKGAEAVDAAVMAVPNIRRTAVYANATYQKLSYEVMILDSRYWFNTPTLQVILKNGLPYRLLLSASMNNSDSRAAMKDAKAALTAIEQLVGTQGEWIESVDPVFSKLSRVMVKF